MYSGVCFLCGRYGVLEEHHVFPAALRDKSERYGLKVGLCGESCHRNGPNAVHKCRDTADGLKQFWQIRWMVEHKASVNDFRKEFYKNYLEPEYYDDERSYPMNIAALSGYMVRDPELRRTESGKAVTTFTIGVQRPGVKDTTDFVACVAWEKKAEFVTKYFKKGQRIEVSGIIITRKYDKDGQTHHITEVRCDQVFFGERKQQSDQPVYGQEYSEPELSEIDDRDDDLPF